MNYKFKRSIALLCVFCLLFTTMFQLIPTAVNATEGNTHSGTWAMVADLTGTDWKAATQDINVAKNTDYVLKLWIKGTSSIDAAIKSGSSWETLVYGENVASSTWTQVTRKFNSGDSTQVHLQIVDIKSEGLVYIDDLYVGTGLNGAPNLAANADFEEGAVGWAYEDGVKISITQPDLHIVNATIDIASAMFNKNITEQRDITVTMTANGNNLTAIKNGTSTLVQNTDYTINGSSVKIAKAYLATLALGNTELKFDFNNGADPSLTIKIVDAVVDAGIIDNFDNLDLVFDTSKATDGTTPTVVTTLNDGTAVFGGDGNRLVGATDDKGSNRTKDSYVIYKTDYDITSVATLAYYWNLTKEASLMVSVSADGVAYTAVPLTRVVLANTGGLADWSKVNFSSFEMPINNARYLKLIIPKADENNSNKFSSWDTQVSRIVINRNIKAVTANPPSAKLDGPTKVTLSCPTVGAQIYYYTNTDATEKLYTEPISISTSAEITAYARKIGLDDSAKSTFKYYSEADETIDTYGQWKSANFPTKITSDAQLVADVAADKAYYDSLTPPERDIYGGMLGSKEKYNLSATGFFRTQKLAFNKGEAEKFVMVDPLGNLYFSLGTDCTGSPGETFTMVQGREEIYQWIPENNGEYTGAFLEGNSAYYSPYIANLIKKYNKPFNQDEYYARMIERLKKLGFTSEGGFAQTPTVENNHTGFPEIPFSYLPDDYKISGTTLFEPYKEGAREALAALMIKNNVAARKDDPKIVGYFFGNELPYNSFDATVLKAKASEFPTKGALIDMLKSKYKNIASLNTAWASNFENFDAMREVEVKLNTDVAGDDMGIFFEQYLEKFYGMLSSEFRKLDKNHMLLGDRYFATVANTSDLRDTLCKVAGKYLDVISYNWYTYEVDVERLKVMAEAADKPIMITEFHFSEPTQGLDAPGIGVNNEVEKGLYYRYYVEKLAASGYAVGAHWFEMMDQAATGRWFQGITGGEAAGIGLFNVADRPYKTFLDSVMATNYNIYDLVTGEDDYLKNPNPPVEEPQKVALIQKTTKNIKIDGIKDASWPGQTISIGDADRVIGSQKENVSADINLAWDAENLYVFAHIKDPTPMQNAYTGDSIWNGDGLEMFVGPQLLDSPGSLKISDSQIVISGLSDFIWYNNKSSQPDIDAVTVMDKDKLGYALEAAIPLSGLNINDAANGRQFRFDIGFDNGEVDKRVGQYLWNGVDGNSASRDKWGMAKLVDASGNQDNITRGEFVGSLIKLLGLTAKVDSNFSDVKVTDKFYNEIGIAKKLGITAGNGKNKFGPNTAITRQDMMVLIVKALTHAGKDIVKGTDADLAKFSDKATISNYAKASIAALVKNGIVVYEGKTINPKGYYSRAEAEVIIQALLKLFTK